MIDTGTCHIGFRCVIRLGTLNQRTEEEEQGEEDEAAATVSFIG
jgi:hypothetical protein